MEDIEQYQREVTAVALEALEGYSFALAGSGAIREHGFTDRFTQDVDLFTSVVSVPEFTAAVHRMVDELDARGYTVDERRRADQFAAVQVTTPEGSVVEVDLAVDWRSSDPVRLAVGPVLSVEDAVASKVSAAYGRAELRDLLDVDAIRRSGRFTDEQLLDLVREREPGFDQGMFAQQLSLIGAGVSTSEAAAYGVDAAELVGVEKRLTAWAETLTQSTQSPAVDASSAQREPLESRLRKAGVPEEAIAARLHAERQHAPAPGAAITRPTPHGVPGTSSAKLPAKMPVINPETAERYGKGRRS